MNFGGFAVPPVSDEKMSYDACGIGVLSPNAEIPATSVRPDPDRKTARGPIQMLFVVRR